jgi:glycosyltransferase involved in cell wall biosynthesis
MLVWSDSPSCTTGFGKVAQEILKRVKGYEITVLGINYNGEFYDRNIHPYNIFMAKDDTGFLGYRKFVQMLTTQKWDLVFTHQDLGIINAITKYIVDERAKQKFKWVAYMPIDNAEFWDMQSIQNADEVLVYSQYGKDVITKKNPEVGERVKVAYLGTDLDKFRPLKNKQELRRKWFNIEDPNTFLAVNVNANRWRKDHPHGILGFKYFNDKYPNSKYYIHAPVKTVDGDLRIMAQSCRLKEGALITKDDVNPLHGYSEEEVNEIYNCADVVISSTMAEGFGLSITESFGAEIPALFPNHTSITELIGANAERGTFIKNSGTKLMAWDKCSYFRDIIDSKDLGDKLQYVIENYKEVKAKTVIAKQWVKQYTWDNIYKLIWDKIL